MGRNVRTSEADLKIYLTRLGVPQASKEACRKSKYHNIIVKVGPFTFQSKAEARRYDELKWLEVGGQISELRVHPPFLLYYGKLKRRYISDFSYVDKKTGELVVEDVKSKPTRTQLFIRNKAMMLEQHNIDVQEIYY